MTKYTIARSYSVGTGGVSDISLEFSTASSWRTAEDSEWDVAGELVLPPYTLVRAQLEKDTRRLEDDIKSDICEFERAIEAAVNNLIATVRLHDCSIGEKKRTLRRNRAILAPIRRLPHEMLSHIFKLHFAGSQAVALPMGNRDLVAKMLVCKAWRHTILDTPHIWTRFCITYCDLRRDSHQLVLHRSLTRSKVLPLDISISIGRTSLFSANASLLKNMISRCGCLDLRLCTAREYYKEEIDCIFGALEASNLVHLTLCIPNQDDVEELQRFMGESISVQRSLSHIQSHLQSLEMFGVDFPPNRLRMPRLKKLKLIHTHFEYAHLRKWITLAPNLLHLDVQYGFRDQNPWDDFTSCLSAFHELRVLKLKQNVALVGSGAVEGALIAACPQVQSLFLVTFYPSIHLRLLKMENLRHLVMSHPRMPESQECQLHLVKWFNCMPNLERFEISEGPEVTSDCAAILMALTADNTSEPTVWPLLKSLIYTIRFPKDLEPGLAAMPAKAIDSIVALSKSRLDGGQNPSLMTTVVLEPQYGSDGRIVIAKDAYYNDLLHAFQMAPALE